MQNTWTIVVTAAVSVVATLATTWFGHWLGLLKDRTLRVEELERNARYIAIRSVCILDPFVSGCVEVAHDEGVPSPPEGELVSNTSLPKLIPPHDVDWRAVDTELMYRILAMPNEIALANQTISFVGSELSNPPDHSEYFWERSIQYARLGLLALQLADDLRTRYRIHGQDIGDRKPREILEQRLLRIERVKAEYEAREAEWTAKIFEDCKVHQMAATSTQQA